MRLSQRLPIITVEETQTSAATLLGFGSGARSLPPILRGLPEQLGLEGKDVVEHPVDAPPLEAVIGDHPRALQLGPQRSPKRSIDPRAPAHLRLLQQLKAAVERELSHAVLANAHVPSTSTLPALVIRTLTRSRDGSE